MGKGTHWDTDDAKWLEGLTLYLVNASWAADVYDAIWTKSSFRLIVDGVVLRGVPKATPGTHNSSDVVKWSTKDISFDDHGCLIILDNQLGKKVKAAHEKDQFYIVKDGPAGPIGDQKVNAMCPC